MNGTPHTGPAPVGAETAAQPAIVARGNDPHVENAPLASASARIVEDGVVMPLWLEFIDKLNAEPNRRLTQRGAAAWYSALLRVEDVPWASVNQAIIRRWSRSGLMAVKKQAWAITEDGIVNVVCAGPAAWLCAIGYGHAVCEAAS